MAEPAVPLLLPIGQFGGRIATSDGEQLRYRVRIGPATHVLSRHQCAGWYAAHGNVSLPEDRQQSLTATIDALSRLGIDGAAAVIDDLLTCGLLATVDPADALPFARRYRLAPLLLGLGNEPAAPDRFAIGLPDQPMLTLARPMFAVWGQADAAPDLWTACLDVAAAERQAKGDRRLFEPSGVLAEFLRSLHDLLRVSGGYLDIAQPRIGPTSEPRR